MAGPKSGARPGGARRPQHRSPPSYLSNLQSLFSHASPVLPLYEAAAGPSSSSSSYFTLSDLWCVRRAHIRRASTRPGSHSAC